VFGFEFGDQTRRAFRAASIVMPTPIQYSDERAQSRKHREQPSPRRRGPRSRRRPLVPPAHNQPRRWRWRRGSADSASSAAPPASGPAKDTSSKAMKTSDEYGPPRPQAGEEAFWPAPTWPGPKCLGKRLPSRSNSDNAKPGGRSEYPDSLSPMMAPIVAAAPTANRVDVRACAAKASSAATDECDPRRATESPRPLKADDGRRTTIYTASGGIVCSIASNNSRPLRLGHSNGRNPQVGVGKEFQTRRC